MSLPARDRRTPPLPPTRAVAGPPRAHAWPGWVRLVVVVLLSAGMFAAVTAAGRAGLAHSGATASRPACPLNAPPPCYAPQVLRTAYAIQPLLDQGIDGRGVTVVLPEEAQTGPARPPVVTDVRQDVVADDRRFDLSPANLQVITTLAATDTSPWLATVEEVVDTEMLHAIAPGATIVELPVNTAAETTPAGYAALFATIVRTAVSHGADVISLSLGVAEDRFTSAEVATINTALEYAAAHHVTFVAPSGDAGPLGHAWPTGSPAPVTQVNLPASDPLVLGVGGTTLVAQPGTHAYVRETVWNSLSLPWNPLPEPSGRGPSAASGGGFSHWFRRPTYQDGVPGIGAMRGVPDVAASAWFDGALSGPHGTSGLFQTDGTSLGAPCWAGLIALADQEAGHALGDVTPAIYRIARGPQGRQAFHDVTIGANTITLSAPPVTIPGSQAGPGWDPVTGWGTPDAQVLIPLLAGR